MNRGRCMLLGSTSQRRWSMPTNLATLTSTGYVWMPGPRGLRGHPGVTTGSPVWLTGIPVFLFFVSLLSTWRKLIVFLCFSHLFRTHLFVFSLLCNPPKPSKSPAPRVSKDIQESIIRVSDVFLCSSVLDHHGRPGAVQCCALCQALQLASYFEANYFDAIVGKTLIDCFMTRSNGPWNCPSWRSDEKAWQAMLFPARNLGFW